MLMENLNLYSLIKKNYRVEYSSHWQIVGQENANQFRPINSFGSL